MPELKFEENGKVHRVFTEEWYRTGIVNIDEIPNLIQSLVAQQKSMIKYIEILHDHIDKLNKK